MSATLTNSDLGQLGLLPPEIRSQIYSLLLRSNRASPPTYGKTSNICTAILATSRVIHHEAIPHLHNTQHHLILSGEPTGSPATLSPAHLSRTFSMHLPRPLGSFSPLPVIPFLRRPTGTPVIPFPHHQTGMFGLPPPGAISCLRNIHVSVYYSTNNRGECECDIEGHLELLHKMDFLALSLHQSPNLATLTLELLNTAQRKVGRARLTSTRVTRQMRRLLLPFSHLGAHVKVWVEGFQTFDHAEMFDALREKRKGRNLWESIDDMWEVELEGGSYVELEGGSYLELKGKSRRGL